MTATWDLYGARPDGSLELLRAGVEENDAGMVALAEPARQYALVGGDRVLRWARCAEGWEWADLRSGTKGRKR